MSVSICVSFDGTVVSPELMLAPYGRAFRTKTKKNFDPYSNS